MSESQPIDITRTVELPAGEPAGGDEDLFERVSADFLAEFRQGHLPDIEVYAREFPTLAADIRELFPTMLAMERVKVQREHSSDGQVSLGAKRIERLGDFQIIREIGRGGMGVVFEAEQQSLERKVALKVLPPNALHDDSHVRRFHREARTAAALHHTNIVPVFGVGFDDGWHYYVMQLIDGEGLDRRFRSPAPQPMLPAEAGRIMLQVADAVQYAHDHGILHRDIKPANILLDRQGNVWITDFGLAQALERDETRTDHVAGTLRYMAPERLRGQADERSDQYSLGITLYELVTGVRAFEGTSSGELLRQISEADPLPARSFIPSLPVDLDTIIQKAISKNPVHRYSSVRDLREDLSRFAEGRPILARPVGTLERLWRWARRNPALAASLGSVAALVLVVAGLLGWGYYHANLQAKELAIAVDKQRIALQNERRAREEQQQARESAEVITQLALGGLDSVFDTFAPSEPYTISLSTAQNGSAVANGESADATASPEAADAESESLVLPPQSRVSSQAAEALSKLLPVYERLAEETGQDVQVRKRAALAQHRLGMISAQLGDIETALQTIQTASQRLEEVASQLPQLDTALRLDRARVLNDLGEIQRLSFQGQEARATHESALQVLTTGGVPLTTRDENLELARTHFELGRPFMFRGPVRGLGPEPSDRRWPHSGGPFSRGDLPPPGDATFDGQGPARPGDFPTLARREQGEPDRGPRDGGGLGDRPGRDRDGRGPDGAREGLFVDRDRDGGRDGGRGRRRDDFFEAERVHLAQAITLLEELSAGSNDTRVTLLLAQCFRERSRQWRREQEAERTHDHDRAVQLLDTLVAGAPQVREFRFELAVVHCDVDIRWWPADRMVEAEQRLSAALDLLTDLIADASEVAAYHALATQVREKLAQVYARTDRRPLAREMLVQAMEQQTALAKNSPDASIHRVWSARLSKPLAELLLQDEEQEQALDLLRDSAQSIEPLIAPWEQRDTPAEFFVAFTLTELYWQMAKLHEQLGQPSEAAAVLARQMQLGPGQSDTRRPPFDRPSADAATPVQAPVAEPQ